MNWRGGLKEIACLVAVAAAVAFLFSDLFTSTAFWSHEKLYVYIRADQVAKEIEAGHYPQAFPDAVYGAGYAFPRFYPPFTLWLSAGLALLVDDAVLGTNLAFFLSVLASGLAMYLMAAALTRDRLVSLAASLLYVSLPYRFVDVYVRGALAESWTFFWYPIVVAGLWRAITRRTFPWYLPVGVAGLVLTHNITAVYFLGFCALVCALGFLWNGWRAAAVPALGLALGLGLSAWFLAPQQYYMRDVWVGDSAFMWADPDQVHAHRVMPHQLFYSWPTLWTGESQRPGYLDEMSFDLGAGQLLVVPLAVGFLVLLRRGRRRVDHFALVLALLCVAAWVACLAFMLYPRPFLLALPGAFSYIQFPWRLLGLSLFAATTATALLARFGGFGPRTRYGLAAAALLLVALVPSFQRAAQVEPGWTASRVLAPDYVREEGRLGFTVLGEYLPRDLDLAALRAGELGEAAFERPRLVSGEGVAVTEWRRSGLDMDATVEGGGACEVVFPLAHYDFYRAEGPRGVPLETFSSDGLLGVRVPEGVGEVAVRQRITPVTRAGLWASLAALLATAACSLLIGWRERAWARLPLFGGPRPQPDLGGAPQPLDADRAAGTVDGRG